MADAGRLRIPSLAPKYDRLYRAGSRHSDTTYDVNLARLSCTCPDFAKRRSAFPDDDARRVCAHIYDTLYSTKVEKGFDLLLQLFIRYGRTMFTYQISSGSLGTFIIGQPFGPGSIRAIGVIEGKPVVATYNIGPGEWNRGETDLKPKVRDEILIRLKTVLPEAFRLS